MPSTLPITTRRAWAVTAALIVVFTPLVVIDAVAADAEPIEVTAIAAVSDPSSPEGTTTTESLEPTTTPSSEPETTTTVAPETTTTSVAPETTTTAPPPPPTTAAPAPPPTEAPAPPPTEAPAPAPAPVAPPAPTSGVWHRLAECETGGDWSLQVRSFGGGLMIHQATWEAMGGLEFASLPSLASMSEQIVVAERIKAATGNNYSAWPGCRRKLGLP